MSESTVVFVAGAKDAPQADLDACAQRLRDAYPKREFDFAFAAAVFEANFKKIGGWSQWAKFVVHGVKYGSTQPTHQAFLVPSQVIGKGTAEIVRLALDARRTVMVEVEAGVFKRAIGLAQTGTDWKDGWFVRV